MSPPWDSSASQFDENELGKVFDRRLARRLATYLRPYKAWVSLAILLAIISAILGVVHPWISKHIIDSYLPPETEAAQIGLRHWCGIYLIILAISFVINASMHYITAWIGQKAMYDLRKQIFEKMHSLSLSFFDRTPSGRLLTRTTSDVQVLNEMLGQGVVQIFTDLVLLIGILIAMFIFDWRLGFLLIFVAPLIVLTSYNFRIKARTAYRAVRKRIAAMNSYLAESLNGVRTIQAFHRQEATVQKYSSMNEKYRDAQIDTVKRYAQFFPLVEGIQSLAVIAVLAYAAYKMGQAGMLKDDALTTGGIVLYIQYLRRFFMPITSLAERYNVFQAAMASSERIFQLLDEKPAVEDPTEPKEITRLDSGVELKNVWFSYVKAQHGENIENVEAIQEPGSNQYGQVNNNDLWVLKDVSLTVPKGTTAALVGATGAGKSTVINLITRLYDVQKGEVLFNDINVRDYRQKELRRHMAIVLQDVFLFSGTIKDNIRLGDTSISDEQVRQAAEYVNAHQFISRLPNGYDNEVLERGATLSTGQKQLLAFARAIAFDPDLLILDEATANIDTETEALIQDALARIMRDRTCIVVAHRLSTIQNADNIAVFHHGRLHEQGTHQELLRTDGLYRNLYELQYKA